MNQIKLHKWNSAEHLKTEDDIALYLKTSQKEAGMDSKFMLKVRRIIAKAKSNLDSKTAHP